MMRSASSKLFAFVRAVVLLGVIAVGVPMALLAAARARFDGSMPFHGVPSPADWEFERIRTALTDRLTDETIADVVIRVALVVAWLAVIVIVLTVIAEVIHMVRHRGVSLPDIRGLGLTQSVARVIAVGLLVVVPLVSSPNRSIALDSAALFDAPAPATVVAADDARPANVWPSRDAAAVEIGVDAHVADAVAPGAVAERAASHEVPNAFGADRPDEAAQPGAGGEYVVRSGDSVYAIAQRIAGPDTSAVASFAGDIIDLNMGREMSDGQRFTNAAYIDVGWVLLLPEGGAVPAAATAPSPTEIVDDGVHVVEEGESLWSIAEDELGDAERWPELFEENRDREFDDGRSLHDPDLIQPGWELDVDVSDDVPEVEAEVVAPSDIIPVADPASAIDLPPPSAAEVVALDQIAPAAPDGPVNVWPERDEADGADLVQTAGVRSPAAADDTGGDADDVLVSDGDDDSSDEAALITFERAAMLSAGVLALLAVRRRHRLRKARPRARLPEPAAGPAATERSLRAIGAGDRFARVVAAIRAAARPLVAGDERVVAALADPDGSVELRLSGSVELAAPWEGAGDTWTVPATTPLELLDDLAASVAMPSPTLVQLGRSTDGRDVFVDLEALEAIEVGGPGHDADAVVAAVAATLAGSLLAEVTTLVGVGVPDDAFLGHRLHIPARDAQRAFEAASDAIGSTAAQARSTFELRTAAEAGEAWEPAVVLAGAAAGTITPPRSRSGLAIVSASPVHGPSSRLAPEGDAWELLPVGVRLHPVGLTGDDVAAIAALVEVPEPVPAPEAVAEPVVDAPAGVDADAAPPLDDDRTLAPGDDEVARRLAAELDDAAPAIAPPDWSLLVRLLGPVDVVSAEGAAVEFERSKTRELIAWLATHRERSTRSSARTALWELDVRDATFANVVSEARRSMARLVDPPESEEWVGRTMTDALPLHDLVRTDADLLAHALDTARVQPPAQAIATLTPAVEWIIGMPFEGTSYLWPDAEGLTSELVLLATSATTELAAHCLSMGDIDGVFDATGRGLRVLPGHEDLIALRMRAHARFGDHAGVRHEWESYERVINADPWSDGEPSPKLVELRLELLNPTR